MEINFSQVLKQLDGNSLINSEKIGEDNQELKALTLATVCINALMASYEDERNLNGLEKVKRFDLATAIYAAIQPLDLESEDQALIKKLIAKGYGPLIVGQAWKMMEGKT